MQLFPSKLKLIVTSRDKSDIQVEFETIPHVRLPMLTGSNVTEETTSDIKLYIHDKFLEIVKEHWFTLGWPGSDIEEELAKHASRIFIWTVTAVAHIKERLSNASTACSAVLSSTEMSFDSIINHSSISYLELITMRRLASLTDKVAARDVSASTSMTVTVPWQDHASSS